jgi:hypothetical protein
MRPMKRNGSLRIAIGVLALLLGLPGLLQVGCPACLAVTGAAGSGCHERSGPELHPACCGGDLKAAGCCGEMKSPEPARGVEAVAVRNLPAPALLVQPTAAVQSLHEGRPRPVPGASQPLYEGAGLYTLHSVLLI